MNGTSHRGRCSLANDVPLAVMMGHLHERLPDLCHVFSDAARAEWADQLVAVAVFGSVGPWTPRFDSDCDFLVVLEHCPPGRTGRSEMALALGRPMNHVMAALS